MIRTNNGLEFCSSEFDTFNKQHGIVRHRTVRHTPQQNRLVERMNKTLIEKVRCMLFNANLSKYFQAETVTTTTYLMNRSPSSTLNFNTPHKVWSGKPSDLSDLKIFSCLAYAHKIRKNQIQEPLEGTLLDIQRESKGTRWCINGNHQGLWSVGMQSLIKNLCCKIELK